MLLWFTRTCTCVYATDIILMTDYLSRIHLLGPYYLDKANIAWGHHGHETKISGIPGYTQFTYVVMILGQTNTAGHTEQKKNDDRSGEAKMRPTS